MKRVVDSLKTIVEAKGWAVPGLVNRNSHHKPKGAMSKEDNLKRKMKSLADLGFHHSMTHLVEEQYKHQKENFVQMDEIAEAQSH